MFFVALACLVLTGCAHTHVWNDATCTESKKCNVCGETEGEPLGHEWEEATCNEPKTCTRCGTIEGEALGHDWEEATCTTPKRCTRCGATDSGVLGHILPGLSCTEGTTYTRCGTAIPALGHDWKNATCTEPKTCTRCGITEGDALGHNAANPTNENHVAATCTENGHYDIVVYCSVCRTELSRETKTEEALGHTTENGVCARCGIERYKTITGRGDDVVSNISVGDGVYRVHFTNSGTRNFVVWVYDKDEDRDLAVNKIGNYDGYYFLTGKAPYTFEIESKGNWSYTIERIGTTNATSFEGKGDYVTEMFSASTGTWHITYKGAHNFVIWLYTTKGRDLIVNEIGNYDGNKRLSIPSGSKAMLVIESDGNWSITPE